VEVSEAGCTAVDTVEIVLQNLPSAAFFADTTGCPDVIFSAAELNAQEYTWNFGIGGNDTTVTSPVITFAYTANGNYGIQLAVTSACGTSNATGALTIDCVDTTSLAEALTHELDVYPNPTNGDLFVNFGSLTGVARLTVTNLAGQVVVQHTVTDLATMPQQHLSLATQPAGVYLLQVEHNGLRAAYRLVVNR
jgi:PKD repeat protein